MLAYGHGPSTDSMRRPQAISIERTASIENTNVTTTGTPTGRIAVGILLMRMPVILSSLVLSVSFKTIAQR